MEQVSCYKSWKKLGRGLLWRFGYGDGVFDKVMGFKSGVSIEYGKIQKMPKHKDMDTVEMKAFADLVLKLGSAANIGVSNDKEVEQISP